MLVMSQDDITRRWWGSCCWILWGVSQHWCVRPRGFGAVNTRVKTPSLNDMRAKQKAIVAKFMTFFQRKSTLVIEMYEHAFYRQKPNWEKIAEFIYSDLCKTQELRSAVKDVQFHPVKMLLFVRFSEEQIRDDIVTRIQSAEGVRWTDYRVG